MSHLKLLVPFDQRSLGNARRILPPAKLDALADDSDLGGGVQLTDIFPVDRKLAQDIALEGHRGRGGSNKMPGELLAIGESDRIRPGLSANQHGTANGQKENAKDGFEIRHFLEGWLLRVYPNAGRPPDPAKSASTRARSPIPTQREGPGSARGEKQPGRPPHRSAARNFRRFRR